MPRRHNDPFNKANSVTFTLVPRSLVEQDDSDTTPNTQKYNLQLKQDINSRGRATVIDETNYMNYLPDEFPVELIVDDTDDTGSYNNIYSSSSGTDTTRQLIDAQSNDSSRLPYEYDYSYHLKQITSNDSIYIDKHGKVYDNRPQYFTDIPESIRESDIFTGAELQSINTSNIEAVQTLQKIRSEQHVKAKLYKDFMLSLDDAGIDEYEWEEPLDTFIGDAMGNDYDTIDEKNDIDTDLYDNDNEIENNSDDNQPIYEYESEYEYDEEENDGSDDGYDTNQYQFNRVNRRAIDDAFDQLLDNEYNDDAIGELDPDIYGNELDGHATTVEFSTIISQYAHQSEQNYENNGNVVELLDNDIKYVTTQKIQQYENTVNSDDDDIMSTISTVYKTRHKNEFDAQSVVSTYSNIENHPTVIAEQKHIRTVKTNPTVAIQLDRYGMPIQKSNDHTLSTQLQSMSIREENEDDTHSELSNTNNNMGEPRDKFESAEEKKARKHAAKQLKRDQRAQKSTMKSMYKSVKQSHDKQQANQMKINVGNLIKL